MNKQDDHSSKTFSSRSKEDEDSYKPPTPSIEQFVQHSALSRYVEVPTLIKIYPAFAPAAHTHTNTRVVRPQQPFTSIHTGNRPLPFNLPDTMNMMTTDAQLEERRRAAIREREREAQAKERNKQLLAKRREDQLRLKQQIEEEAKMRETLVKEAEARRIGAVESTRFYAINKKEEEERRREEVALGLCFSLLHTKAHPEQPS